MSKFIRVRRGEKIVLRVKKRRKQTDNRVLPKTSGRRGLLPYIEMESAYRPRRGGRGIEVFDLAINANGTYPFFERTLLGLTGYSLQGVPDRIFNFLSYDINSLMLGRFNAANFKRIDYQHSWARFTDLVFYDGNSKNILALSEPDKRTYLSDKTFLVSNSVLAPPPSGFQNGKILEQTFKHLRVNSAIAFYQFDTGDTVNFRVTSTPDYLDPETYEPNPRVEINFAAKKKIELYLVPRFWRVNPRHSAYYSTPLNPSVFYNTELSGATYAPFPRVFLDQLNNYGVSHLNLNRARGGETTLENENWKYFKFLPGTNATINALKTFNTAFLGNTAHSPVTAREKTASVLQAPAIPNFSISGWTQILTNFNALTTSFRRFSLTDEALAPYAGEPSITGNPIPNGEPNIGYFAPDKGTLLAIIKADDALFYVWNDVSNVLAVADSRYLPPATIRFATTQGFAPPTQTVDSSIYMDLYTAGLTQDMW